MRTLIAARHILAHSAGHHALLRDGEIVYEGTRVIFVGHGYTGPIDESLDLGESLVMPGLIDLDALADIDHLVLDSWHDEERADGLVWSQEYAARSGDVFTAEERLVVRQYALVQLALHGVTTYMPIASETHSAWAESFDEMVGVAEISRRIGLRGYLGPSYRSGVNVVRPDRSRGVHWDLAAGRAGLADAVRFLDHCAQLDDPLVNGVLLPCRIETLDPELMRATAAVSAERGTLVRLHALQGLVERELVVQTHHMTPLDLIAATGLLTDRLLLPHAIFTDRSSRLTPQARHDDLQRLADAGVSVVHCPLTSLRYGDVLESFRRYREAGITLALGTDSFPPDLVRGMDVGVHLAKVVDGRDDASPAQDYVDAATLGGAKALRRPDLGRIEPGAQADLVAFSLSDLRDGVLDDPIRSLLLNGSARQVTHTVVAGRMVVRDGRVPGVDVAQLRCQAQALFEKMREAYTGRDHRHRSRDGLFPPSFPPFREPQPQRRQTTAVTR
jgi:8-oxoguanine deaminase